MADQPRQPAPGQPYDLAEYHAALIAERDSWISIYEDYGDPEAAGRIAAYRLALILLHGATHGDYGATREQMRGKGDAR